MWPFSSPSTKDKTVNHRKLDADFAVAGQITPEQVQAIADAGFKSILCARPDREEVDVHDVLAIALHQVLQSLDAGDAPLSLRSLEDVAGVVLPLRRL